MQERNLQMAYKIAEAAEKYGGRAYFVGGYVRDFLLGKVCYDIDIEVHGIEAEELERILSELGECEKDGCLYGVFNLQGYSLDIALPRTEIRTGAGHRDFAVTVAPFIGTEKAAERRDFTVNAMLQDVLTGEIIDHFNGREHLAARVLRHVNDGSFAEDALRVLRGAQFAARMGFSMAEETKALCRDMDLSVLPRIRVMEETSKALLFAEKPSVYFTLLKEIGQLSVLFPELFALIGVEQNAKHHAEGDVFVHTVMVLDECAKRRPLVKEPLGFMLAALTHDMGKAICTELVGGEIHAYEHETKGLPIIERFMHRLTDERRLIDYVLNMAELHMKPNTLAAAGSSPKKTNHLFDRSVEPSDLIHLAVADSLGKIAPRPYYETEPFLLERLEVYNRIKEQPEVTGDDLIAAGLKPDKRFTELLAFAHKLHLAGIGKENALKQTLAYARKLK